MRAVVDTRKHPPEVPLDHVVAGLTLLERNVRMASVLGFDEILVVAHGHAPEIERVASRYEQARVVDELPSDRALLLDSSIVYERATPPRELVRVRTPQDARRAEHLLWQGCRKDVDGIISRHLNRYFSLAISRRLAPTGWKPNHISLVTFTLGLASGVLAALGGYMWLMLAGVLFQLTSMLDGVDGELARVKYEFSVTGEWLDTISDDTSDVFFYGGVGLGAWQTYADPTGLVGPEIWLWLGGVAVVGKLLSMLFYYRALIAKGRGDLYVFEWSFDSAEEKSGLQRFLSKAKYLTKNDFIAFAAMMLGYFGLLPYLLVAAAPGTVGVALGVMFQRRGN